MILCTTILLNVRNSILGAHLGLEQLSPEIKNYVPTQWPHNFLDQNAVSHPMPHIFFSIFLSPDPLGCENWWPTPMNDPPRLE